MNYRYTHTGTEATTGYFSCEPHPPLSLDAAFDYLAEHPLDDFMRRHLLNRIGAMSEAELERTLTRLFPVSPLPEAVDALLRECLLLAPPMERVLAPFLSGNEETGRAAGHDALATSLIFLRWQRLPDRMLHSAWVEKFAANIQGHHALPPLADIGLAPLYSEVELERELFWQGAAPITLPQEYSRFAAKPPDEAYTRPPSAETATLAEERLHRAGIIAGAEMRHVSSLSPIALLRPWSISLRIQAGRHEYSLAGQGTTYGRGFSLGDARASCLMEMVERSSVYLSVVGGAVENRLRETPVITSTRSALLESGALALDPNDFPSEVPYENSLLSWIAGQAATGEVVYAPLQMTGLFCNLDEVALSDSPGSTGIATGNTLEEAKVAALTEIFERDAESTTPFSKASCFTLASRDPRLAALLHDYAARGINVQFQDITGPLGLPVYQCFVTGLKGGIARGYGANLCASRAVLSALTETPFPYPEGGPSGPLLRNLPVCYLEDFPDYSFESPTRNLALLESLLIASNRPPVYVTLTRADLLFPVVRAFIPGMELAADTGPQSRVPLRLYAAYMRAQGLRP